MALSDYAHHNEDQHAIWWLEEGQWYGREEFDEYDPDDYLPCDEDDDIEDIDEVFPEPAEDAHLEAAYEERFTMEWD